MIEYDHGSNFMRFYVEAGEALRIEGNRRVLIGQTVNTIIGGHLARLQIGGTDYNTSTVSITNNTNDANGAYLMLAKQRSGSPGGNTIVTSGDEVGVVRFCASDGSDMAHRVAQIYAEVDGTPGSIDMPGRLVFSTSADGSAYQFSGPGATAGNNPNFTFYKGHTYLIDNSSHVSSHPLQIRTSNGGSAFTTGVTENFNSTAGLTQFIVPHEPSDTTLVYQCTNHSSMVGNITIV